MPEDLSQAMPLDGAPEPEPQTTTPEPPDDDAEPEGVVQVGDKRLVDVSILAAERKRIREATERRIRDTELTPLQQKAQEADALREALNAARPYVDLVKRNPQLLQQQEVAPEDQIGDDEAEQEARDLQLYDANSQLDLRTAKKIIVKRRQEAYSLAQQAAQQAVAPYAQTSAEMASRQNFATMAQMTDQQGNPLVDPRILAVEWVEFSQQPNGQELLADPRVAEVVLERAIGRSVRQGKGRTQVLARSPIYSEASGGRVGGGPVALTPLDRKLGITEKDHKEFAGKFNPGGMSQIGD